MKAYIIGSVFFLFFLLQGGRSKVVAQYYALGENPASTKWGEIKTEEFQVIYPLPYVDQAQKVANILDVAFKYVGKSLKHKPPKISIILQGNTANSNGFVTWAPKRAELYTLPPQSDDQTDWLANLAIHEMRHVVQIDNLNKGLTRVFYYLLGEQGVGLSLGMTTPLWFLEGDAVGAETVYSEGGRGRVPGFNLKLRTQLIETGKYSYEKASFGSYKSIVPNHYELGYHLTTLAKKQFGFDVWGKVFNRIGKMPITPFRFSTAVKKETGLHSKQLYNVVMDSLLSNWQKTVDSIPVSPFEKTNTKNKKVPTHYLFPFKTEEGTVCIKNGYGDINQLCIIDSVGEETILSKLGVWENSRLYVKNGIAVWSEIYPDKRWAYRSFSDLMLFDLKTNKLNRLSRKERIYSPSINETGEEVVFVSVGDSGLSSINLFNLKTNSNTKVWQDQVYRSLKYPDFIGEESIVFVRFTSGIGNELIQYNYKTNAKEVLLKTAFTIDQIYVDGKDVYYHSNENGLDNIYVFSVENKQSKRLTNAKHAAMYPSVYQNQLSYSDYDLLGYDAVETTLNNQILQDEFFNTLFVEDLVADEGGFVLSDSVKNEAFESKKYSKLKHLINLHSWQPVAWDYENIEPPSLGLSLLSQNKLSSTVAVLGAAFEPSQHKEQYYATLNYNGWYPKIKMGISQTKWSDYQVRIATEIDTNKYEIDRVNNTLNATASVPLKWNKKQYIYYFTPTVNGDVEQVNYKGDFNYSYNVIPINYSVSFSRIHRSSKRDIVGKWRQSVTLGYQNTPFSSSNRNEEYLYGSSLFYLPGGGKHQRFKAYYAYQQALSFGLNYKSYISVPRGYQIVPSKQSHSLKVDWVSPIAYPDWNVWFLAYVQRLKVDLFYDWGIYFDDSQRLDLRSVGAELTMDTNLLRYYFLFDIGFRSSYLISTNSYRTDILFTLGF